MKISVNMLPDFVLPNLQHRYQLQRHLNHADFRDLPSPYPTHPSAGRFAEIYAHSVAGVEDNVELILCDILQQYVYSFGVP